MRRPRRHGIVRALAAGALAGGIALAACRQPKEEDLGKERILRARISRDSQWSSCDPARTAAAPGYCRTPEEAVRVTGTRRLRGAGEERASALRTLLLDRRSERLDRVIARFEAEVRKSPGSPDPLVDLSAAQLTAGWAQESAVRFVDALESAERALEIDKKSSRACFNRAFALEELGLREIARQGWSRCEGLEEEGSGWQEEAHERAEALAVAPPVRFR